jgi:hypothetical protein
MPSIAKSGKLRTMCLSSTIEWRASVGDRVAGVDDRVKDVDDKVKAVDDKLLLWRSLMVRNVLSSINYQKLTNS